VTNELVGKNLRKKAIKRFMWRDERKKKQDSFTTSLPRTRAANGERTFSAREHIRSVKLRKGLDHNKNVVWKLPSDTPSDRIGIENIFIHPLITLATINEAIEDITSDQRDINMLEYTQVYAMESVTVYGKYR
jgi:hypothetical protein